MSVTERSSSQIGVFQIWSCHWHKTIRLCCRNNAGWHGSDTYAGHALPFADACHALRANEARVRHWLVVAGERTCAFLCVEVPHLTP